MKLEVVQLLKKDRDKDGIVVTLYRCVLEGGELQTVDGDGSVVTGKLVLESDNFDALREYVEQRIGTEVSLKLSVVNRRLTDFSEVKVQGFGLENGGGEEEQCSKQ